MALPSIKNSVGMAVTAVADSGVGALTVGAALSGGYQTAATAYGANANIDIRIEEGDTWEVCRDCTYTHSGTTVTRGTLEDGSSGTSTRVAFTSAAKVYVVESAERMRRTVGGYLEHASHDGSAAVTGVVGTLHVFTGLTADRDFTLPASAQAGDRIGVAFPVGSASYEILLKSASGDKINNVDCSTTEWSRLFIAGETVIFRCVDASTVDWVVEHPGLIASKCSVTGIFTHTSTSASQAADFAGITPTIDVGGLADIAGDRLLIRRAGSYIVSIVASISASATGKYIAGQLIKNEDVLLTARDSSSVGGSILAARTEIVPLAVDDALTLQASQSDSTSETVTWMITLTEVV